MKSPKEELDLLNITVPLSTVAILTVAFLSMLLFPLILLVVPTPLTLTDMVLLLVIAEFMLAIIGIICIYRNRNVTIFKSSEISTVKEPVQLTVLREALDRGEIQKVKHSTNAPKTLPMVNTLNEYHAWRRLKKLRSALENSPMLFLFVGLEGFTLSIIALLNDVDTVWANGIVIVMGIVAATIPILLVVDIIALQILSRIKDRT
jgi:uncharacterized membrane protein YfhO